jgi:RNA polymerase sigma-70 factor (ECF subfamily)
MDEAPLSEDPLVSAVRAGDPAAWQALIERFEGRLHAFARSRIGDRDLSEDIVQETFIGFLTSLPNYDSRRPLEGYLFSICAYKIADHLRRQGRRPVLHMGHGSDENDPVARLTGGRVASSIARSVERKQLEESAVARAIAEAIARWKQNGDWTKLKCLELLLVVGLPNREVAEKTGLTEQQVANYKSDFLIRLKSTLARVGLDSEVFPELQE